MPPLRHHSEDLRDLVPFFLGKLSQQGRVTCSPAATQLLLRHTWPGNAAQLWQVLKQVVQRRRVGQIMPEDLPPECWTVSRRVLSPLESIERDAIVQSLLDHGGNKIRAARALGMSRATIYRRIHEYGIVTPQGELTRAGRAGAANRRPGRLSRGCAGAAATGARPKAWRGPLGGGAGRVQRAAGRGLGAARAVGAARRGRPRGGRGRAGRGGRGGRAGVRGARGTSPGRS